MSPLPQYALLAYTPDDLREELRRRKEVDPLFAAVKEHHDQAGDDRCHEDDAKLYEAAGLEPASTRLPCREEFLESCARFYRQRQNPDDPPGPDGMTIAQLEAEVTRLTAERDHLRAALIDTVVGEAGGEGPAERWVDGLIAEYRKTYKSEGGGGG